MEPPHASVEAVVDALMKTDLSAAGIEALEAAARRPVHAAPTLNQPFAGPPSQLQPNGIKLQHVPQGQLPFGMHPAQGPPFAGALVASSSCIFAKLSCTMSVHRSLAMTNGLAMARFFLSKIRQQLSSVLAS